MALRNGTEALELLDLSAALDTDTHQTLLMIGKELDIDPMSKAQELSEEGVQTIHVQSSVDQGKDPRTQGRRACDDGWIWYSSKCYYFSEAEGNWTMANDSCTTLNSLLAVIDNPLELDFVVRYNGVSDHWIGLKKDPNGTWKWCNGIKFNNWFKISEFSECAFLYYHHIRSGECFNARKWICTRISSDERGRKNRSLQLMTQSSREHFIKPR
ncbi:C-type lectin domain family 2 member B-like [Pleurodeles waltl]|uniref:C-type lectin domain family 2 member B-like n=1 Tax=Pleurodeles waltl TaxID=8319 RepID=UPI0037094EAA